MGLIAAEGFEGAGYENDPFWTEVVSGGDCLLDEDYTYASAGINPPIPGNTPGSQLLRAVVESASEPSAFAYHTYGSDKTVSYERFYMYTENIYLTVANSCFVLTNFNVTSDLIYGVRIYEDIGWGSRLQLVYWTDGGLLGSDPVSISNSTWYRVEVKYDTVADTWGLLVNGAVIDSGALVNPLIPRIVALGLSLYTDPGLFGDMEILYDLWEHRDDDYPGIDVEFVEGAKMGDSSTSAFIKNFTEGISISDLVTKSMEKVVTETVEISDSFVRVVTFIRSLTDGVKIADPVAKAMTKIFSDGYKVSDSVAKAVTKVLSDGVSIIESSIIGSLRHVPGGAWTGVEKLYDLLAGVFWATVSEVSTGWSKVTEKTTSFSDVSEKTTGWTKVTEKTPDWTESE